MNVRIKIGEFYDKVPITCPDAKAVVDGKEYSLPERFYVNSNPDPSIKYAFRLFHLHSEKEAGQILNELPKEFSPALEIKKVGRDFNGLGIERFWIVKEGFGTIEECYDQWKSLFGELHPDYRKRTSIEGGTYRRYPENPAEKVIVSDQDESPLFSGSKIEISSESWIEIKDAPVGETFHWEHTENLKFSGKMHFIPGENGVLAVNEIPLEEYLASVNSSEMSAKAPIEFLKAQTIAARGTVIATMDCHHHGEPFDLCNGDHCQCYYGSDRIENRSRQAAEATNGMILTYKGKVCDTRYAKICGGITEKFHHVWENYDPEYLPKKFDGEGEITEYEHWNEYIDDKPDCYCNPDKYPYPDYFDYARPWFRWTIEYEADKIAKAIEERIGIELGTIQEVEIISRGESGRITGLKIIGTSQLLIVFGELEIRRVLSESHLPSSCFYSEFKNGKIIFHGAGWGHGVGMCQMGALNMAILGYNYRQILDHYYPHTEFYKIDNNI